MKRLALILLLALGPQAAWALEAIVDRTIIDSNDVLELNVRTDENVFLGDPDFSALEADWTLLNTQRSSQISIINGRQQANTTWRVTLQPRRVGELRIPPINFRGENTQALVIRVTEPSPEEQAQIDELVFLRTVVSEESLYVQQPLTYRVRLYYAPDAQLYGDIPGAPEVQNAVVEPLGGSTPTYEYIRGQRYNVIEQRYAIIPQRSGTLTLRPEEFVGALRVRTRRGYERKNIRVVSNGHAIDVRPPPAAWPDAEPWLPAEDLTLTQQWIPAPPRFEVGQPITRTLTLQGRNVAASALPPLNPEAPEGARLYPDQPALDEGLADDTLMATRIESATVIPSRAGEIAFPEIGVTWFDTDDGQIKRTVLAGMRFEATATGAPAAPSGAGQGAPESGPASAAEQPTAIPDASGTGEPLPALGPRADDPVWRWLAIAFGLAWLVTAVLYLRKRPTSEAGAPAPGRSAAVAALPASEAAAFSTLERACKRNDAHSARIALDNWLRHLTGRTAAPARGLALDDQATLTPLMTDLEGALYGLDHKANWNGTALLGWAAARRSKGPARNREEVQLLPLYRTG